MQGKEKESTFNLNRINFGARVYNPTIGRWDRVDPMAEKYYAYSSYNYSLNNPVSNTDPNGMWVRIPGGYETNDPDEIAAVLDDSKRKSKEDKDKDKNKKNDVKPVLTDKEALWEMARRANKEGGITFLSFAFSGEGLAFLTNLLYDSFGSGSLSDDSDPTLKALEMVDNYATGKLAASAGVLAAKVAKNLKDVKMLNSTILKQQGVDAHALKRDFLGKSAKIAEYDLYKHTKTGEILIYKKGGVGEPISTGQFIK